MRINDVRLFGQFQDCKAFTDQSLRLERGHIWKEFGRWYQGCFVMDGTNFVSVRVEHDYFENAKELFEQCQDRVIEGVLHTDIGRGTGVVSHWVEITKCSLVLAPIGKPAE